MVTNAATVTGSRTRILAEAGHAARAAFASAGAWFSRLAVTGQMGVGREREIGRRTGARC